MDWLTRRPNIAVRHLSAGFFGCQTVAAVINAVRCFSLYQWSV